MRGFVKGCSWTHWAAFASVLLFLGLVVRFWHPVYGFTAFLQLSEQSRSVGIDAVRENPVFVYAGDGGYDGQYYAQLACDPSLRDEKLPTAVDNLAYRARRILPAALAWVLSGGNTSLAPRVYSVLNVFAWMMLAALCWRLLEVRDVRTWLAWAGLLFSAGALHCVRLSLTDLIATTFIAAALLAHERGYFKTGAFSLAASALSKETALFSTLALMRGPWRDPRSWIGNTLSVVIVATPLAAWLFYIHHAVGPADAGFSNFTTPFSGFLEKWRQTIADLTHEKDHLLAAGTLLALIGFSVQLSWLGCRPALHDKTWWAALLYAALAVFLSRDVWEGHPGAYTRVLLPLHFFFTLGAVRRGALTGVIVTANLGVLSGLIAFQNVNMDTRELGAYRSGDLAVVARTADGWFPTEQKNFWGRRTWSSGDAGVAFTSWPADKQARINLEFFIRGYVPRLVSISQGDVVLWQGKISEEKQHLRLTGVELGNGSGAISFTTSEPASITSNAPDGRKLAFAIYDLRIHIAE
jgi:hypothetical protein